MHLKMADLIENTTSISSLHDMDILWYYDDCVKDPF